MLALGEQYGYELPLSRATLTVNLRQRKVIVEKLQENLKVLRGSTIALWGLSFKPNTDDLRDAPALDIARRLISLGVHVKAYDPVALERCQRECPELDMEYACTYCKAVQGADAVVLVTEWEEFFRVKWDKVADAMRGDLFVDGRNVFEPERIERCGLTYVGVGR
jgi:UDPglucose 6-dehydrogenase